MIPRMKFAHLPTAVEPLPRLSSLLGGPSILVKRDDQTGLAMGGNKTRKLEFVIAEALANGARTLISVGAAQSNHCRQTAALAARVGMRCILVLNGDLQQAPNGNLLLDQLFGAEIVWTSREQRETVLQKTFDDAWAAGLRPFLVPLGASTPIGSLGYVYAFEEVMNQGIEVDWMVVASSSAGTQAGLALGAARVKWAGKVMGISIDQKADELKQCVAELACGASDRMGENIKITSNDIWVNDDYLGAGYGILGTPEIEAIQLFARYEGLLLDPVYTGRAAAGMIDLIRKGFFKPGEKILFWHTGGTPALFAEHYAASLGR